VPGGPPRPPGFVPPSCTHVLPKRPQLRLIYGGHGGPVTDLVWCPEETGACMIASTNAEVPDERDEGLRPAQPDVLQVWRPALHLF